MSDEREALLDHISAMGRELAPATIASLASEIAAGGDGVPANARVRYLRERLKELWAATPGVDQGEVAWALLGAQRAAGDVARAQTLSIVWTGPDTNVPVRRNDEALYEVVASAEKDLLVVSFVVYRVPRIAKGLADAVGRGVDVTLVVERHDSEGVEKEGAFDPIKAFGGLPDGVRVLEWDVSRRRVVNDRLGYIHAKAAVADRSLAFISSANLTVYGLEANMELGVLIKGGVVPARVAQQFVELESHGDLVPVVAVA